MTVTLKSYVIFWALSRARLSEYCWRKNLFTVTFYEAQFMLREPTFFLLQSRAFFR